MDTSAKYILMCGEAKEIQAAWGYKEGDWCQHIDCTVPLVLGQVVEGENETTLFDKFVEVMKTETWVWLPRQDQLQEMLGKPNATLQKFIAWYELADQFNSMEKLWLVFVMKEKYGKKWDGKAWGEIMGKKSAERIKIEKLLAQILTE
jgi:hypothetical protein